MIDRIVNNLWMLFYVILRVLAAVWAMVFIVIVVLSVVWVIWSIIRWIGGKHDTGRENRETGAEDRD